METVVHILRLRASGALAEMKEKGIKWVFIGGVDNALLKMADTILVRNGN